jgi:4-hydroxybenzoate polyprenyltransferase
MQTEMTPDEARTALNSVTRDRLRVVEEIGVPRWYWWGIALGWVALGYVSDLKHAWLTAAATLLFGAVHSAVAPRVVSGRRRTGSLSVRRELAGPRTPALIFGALIALALVTIVGALLVSADGARHPATIASVFVALMILLGGPQLLAAVRRRAASRITSA